LSDPTARRGDNINALLQAIHDSRKGWSEWQMKTFLFERYRFGIREQTLHSIVKQLTDRKILIKKPIRKGVNVFLYHINKEVYTPQPRRRKQ